MYRTGYQAIKTIWMGGFTSDYLAVAESYHMIDDTIKINPLHLRARNPGEDDDMPLRRSFSDMIRNHIYTIWEDGELEDLIELLNLEGAGYNSQLY